MRRRGYKAYPASRPRKVGGEEITRILSRGGMVIERGGVLCVYRTRDSRRMRVGVTRLETLAGLEAEGAVQREAGPPARWLAGGFR